MEGEELKVVDPHRCQVKQEIGGGESDDDRPVKIPGNQVVVDKHLDQNRSGQIRRRRRQEGDEGEDQGLPVGLQIAEQSTHHHGQHLPVQPATPAAAAGTCRHTSRPGPSVVRGFPVPGSARFPGPGCDPPFPRRSIGGR